MKFNIDPQIFEKYQDLKIGLVIIKNLANERRISTVEGLLRGVTAQRGTEFSRKDIDAETLIKVWNQAYSKENLNPKKEQPQVRALLFSAQSGKEIPHTNSILDLSNYFTLKYLLPLRNIDLDWLCGDLSLTFTKGGEPFREATSIEVEEAGEAEVAYMDNGGIVSRYWNHKECERTRITNQSKNTAIFVEDLSKMTSDQFSQILTEIGSTIEKYIGGEISINILNEENPSADLGVEGRKNVDDSKISAQERAYYVSRQKQENKSKIMAIIKTETASITKASVISNIKPNSDKIEINDPHTLKEKIREAVEQGIVKAYSKPLKTNVHIEYPNQKDHGDYSCGVAMQMSKDLATPPREIAEKLQSHISTDDFIDRVEIAGPGFLNFFIKKEYLINEVQDILDLKNDYGKSKVGDKKSIIVEYSSPNMAKPLGAQHLISTTLGQSLYNIFKFIGYDAVSLNYLGDWGTQFGKLIYAYKRWGKKRDVDEGGIDELLRLYVKFHNEAEKQPEIEDDARKEFKIFEEGDRENRKIWQWFIDISLKSIQKTYDKLSNIHFDHMEGESFYENKMSEILADGKQRGVFVEGEEGAFIIEYDDPNIPPFLVQKKDGATLYSTRDFAALKERINKWRPLKILYVVDVAQTLQFKQLFKGAERFPWYHGEGVHVWFGRMSFKDGQMSTRKGNVILLDSILEEAIKRARAVLEEKSSHLEDKDQIASIVGTGALKYSILSQNRTTDIVFDWDKMLSLDGNSSPYLQYTYARAKSILRKADKEEHEKTKDSDDTKDKIDSLLRTLPKFTEAVLSAAYEYKPNILCNYLYSLAQEFNSFYNTVTVLKAEEENDKKFRLQLVEATSQILKNGLRILGIDVIEAM